MPPGTKHKAGLPNLKVLTGETIPDEPDVDPSGDAIEIVYGGTTEAGRRDAEIRRLRAQLASERRKRARTDASDEEDDEVEFAARHPRRVHAALGPPISRETVQAVHQMLASEAAYQAELESSPYVQFAIYVADQELGSKDRYRYLNNTFRKMVDSLYGSVAPGMDTGRMVATAAAALRIMGDTLRAFPGTAEELGTADARDSFARVYRDLAEATDHMRRRQAVLEELRRLSRPSASGALRTVVAPELLMRVEQTLGTARMLDATMSRYPQPSPESIIEDAAGRLALAAAVIAAGIMQRHRTSALPKSRLTTKLDVASHTEAMFGLVTFLRNRSGSVPFGPRPGLRTTPDGIPIDLGF